MRALGSERSRKCRLGFLTRGKGFLAERYFALEIRQSGGTMVAVREGANKLLYTGREVVCTT
ncbi:hypothetical protein E2C01_011431 [Portunus trituberculatus]|uniref:Uncharacterized protein n=1 Tax=Portunus trituberculatus TaxID=210409 RepID=A0A5B7DBV8_PORTR|nr:hypothetical protein [Portunus trituberculatus]